MENALTEKNTLIESITADNEAMGSRITALETSILGKESQIQTLSSAVDEKDSRISELTETIAELKDKSGNDSTDAVPAASASSEPDIADKAAVSNSADIPDNTEELKNLKSEVENKSLMIFTLNSAVAEKDARIQTLSNELEEKNTLIETLQASLSEKNTEAENLTAVVADQETQISTQKTNLSDLSQQIETLNTDLSSRTEQISSLENDLSDKAKIIETLQAEIAVKAQQIDSLTADAAARTEETEKSQIAEADLQSLSDENASLQEKLAVCEKRIEDLQNLYINTFVSSSGNSLSLDGSEDVIVVKRIRIRDKNNPNVHKKPKFSSRVIGFAKASTEYEILDVSDNGWYQIRLENGKTGWIHPNAGTLNTFEFNFDSIGTETEP